MNARHKRHCQALRKAIRAIGLELVVKDDKNENENVPDSVLREDGVGFKIDTVG